MLYLKSTLHNTLKATRHYIKKDCIASATRMRRARMRTASGRPSTTSPASAWPAPARINCLSPYTLTRVALCCCLQGEHAHRIWSAIYNQSCFSDGVSCSEERVFYRLLSGMHASISTHLAADYLLDEQKGLWGPNLSEFKERLGTPDKL